MAVYSYSKKYTSIGNLGLCPLPVPHRESLAEGLGLLMKKLPLVSNDEGTDRWDSLPSTSSPFSPP